MMERNMSNISLIKSILQKKLIYSDYLEIENLLDGLEVEVKNPKRYIYNQEGLEMLEEVFDIKFNLEELNLKDFNYGCLEAE